MTRTPRTHRPKTRQGTLIYLYWKARSYTLLVWDCITMGPRPAWAMYQAAKQAARIINNRSAAEQAPIYEVGSPEFNAQIVSAIHALNEQLEPQGKRIPERVAIDIISRTTREYGQPGGSSH
jgi:hypothetical protein